MARIGLRNIKTALAVFICMVISKLCKLEYPFFVAIAAIISMENSLMNSFKAGKSRILGTFIEAGIGLICALIKPGNAVLCGIGMIVVVYLCNFLKWHRPIPIAGVVFMAIMVSLNGKNHFIETFPTSPPPGSPLKLNCSIEEASFLYKSSDTHQFRFQILFRFLSLYILKSATLNRLS